VKTASPHSAEAPGARLLARWERLHRLPLGTRLFSWLVGYAAPYTGSIRAHIVALRPGHVIATLAERRAVRNHLGSVHAVALVNLAEVTSGLAMLTALPPGLRGIVTGLSIEYHKKARGRLVAESSVALPLRDSPGEVTVEAVIRDHSGDEVARCAVRWTVGPLRELPSPAT
jgi:acyl-coenzyme A thioesterase PaaI-like protein